MCKNNIGNKNCCFIINYLGDLNMFKTKQMKQMAKKGFSMVELLLVFAIILGAAIIVFVAYPKAQDSQLATQEQQNLATIQAGVKNLYSGANSYGGANPITTATVVQSNVVPQNMIIPGTDTMSNKWNGQVTVASATSTGGIAGDAFSITYNNVPVTPCVKLVTSAGLNFDRVTVGTTVIKDQRTAGSETINVPALTTACQAGGENNVIEFVAR